MWSMIFDPPAITLKMIQCIIFTSLSVDPRSRLRYYMPSLSRLSAASTSSPSPPVSSGDDLPHTPVINSITSTLNAYAETRSPRPPPVPLNPNSDDFVKFSPSLDDYANVCPHNVEDALMLVTQARRTCSTTYNMHHDDITPVKSAYSSRFSKDEDGFLIVK